MHEKSSKILYVTYDGDKDQDSAGDYQHGNAKALRDDPSRNTGHGFFDRFFSSGTIRHGTKAGDPQPIRADHAAEKRKL